MTNGDGVMMRKNNIPMMRLCNDIMDNPGRMDHYAMMAVAGIVIVYRGPPNNILSCRDGASNETI